MSVAYAQVAAFYKDAPLNVAGCQKTNDAFCQLALTFAAVMNGSELPKGVKTDDVVFSERIRNRVEARTLTELATFAAFSEEEAKALVLSVCKPEKEDGTETVLPQKWHLYVAILAYQEENALDTFSEGCKTRTGKFSVKPFYERAPFQAEFRRWLFTAAGVEINAKWRDVAAVIERKTKNQ